MRDPLENTIKTIPASIHNPSASQNGRRIVFMGTPQIAADVLQSLLDADCQVVLAVSQPDKKTGRKQKLMASPVKQLAQAHHIPVFQPVSIKKDYQAILDARPDLIVTCAYGQIVPVEVLEAPRTFCVNLHGSLLPAYRGAAPIQRAIWDGQKVSGMSLMKMEAGMDTGPVLDTACLELRDEDTSETIFAKMGPLAGDLVVKNLDLLLQGQPVFQAQDPTLATYAPRLEKAEEKIDFSQPDRQIFNQIRALAKAPGAYGLVDHKKLKILKARYVPGSFQEAGVLAAEGKKGLSLGLQEGKLDLLEVQMEGKPAMNIADFMNGQGRSLTGKKVV